MEPSRWPNLRLWRAAPAYFKRNRKSDTPRRSKKQKSLSAYDPNELGLVLRAGGLGPCRHSCTYARTIPRTPQLMLKPPMRTPLATLRSLRTNCLRDYVDVVFPFIGFKALPASTTIEHRATFRCTGGGSLWVTATNSWPRPRIVPSMPRHSVGMIWRYSAARGFAPSTTWPAQGSSGRLTAATSSRCIAIGLSSNERKTDLGACITVGLRTQLKSPCLGSLIAKIRLVDLRLRLLMLSCAADFFGSPFMLGGHIECAADQPNNLVCGHR